MTVGISSITLRLNAFTMLGTILKSIEKIIIIPVQMLKCLRAEKQTYCCTRCLTFVLIFKYVHPIVDYSLLILIFKCKDGFAGDGKVCGRDHDMDGIPTKALSCLDQHCKQVIMIRPLSFIFSL